MKYRDKIIQLRSQGRTYREICDVLNCSKGLVSYHCGIGQKEKHNNNQRKRRKSNPLRNKMEEFLRRNYIKKPSLNTSPLYRKYIDFFKTLVNNRRNGRMQPTFTMEQLLDKIGPSPRCYLTGERIDLEQPKSYQLDHIIPASRGGDNSLDNLGLCKKEVNISKRDMTKEEYLELCVKVLKFNGYSVKKSGLEGI